MFNALFAAASMLIAVPTGVKIFNWLATMWGGALRFRTPLLFACGFIAMFTIGGLTGVTVAMVPFDWQMQDTYYVVAHLHNVLFGGTLFAVFAGIYYWFPKVTGRRLSERLGKANFWFMLVGFIVTFLPMYVLGLLGMPRRVYTYAPDLGWNWLNLISTLGGYTIAVGVTLFLVNVVRSLRSGEPAGDDPWDAWTLEWATTSPPPPENFGALPLVTGVRPLHDFKLAGWRPSPPARRQATAEAEAAADPGSPYPIAVAVGMLGVAAGALASRLILVFAAVFLVGALVAWGWQTWGPAEDDRGEGDEAVDLEFTDRAPRTAAGVGMLFFLASETVFFGALIASYAHLRVRLGVWPPPGVPPLEGGLAAINTLILLTSGVAAHWAGSSLAAGRRAPIRDGHRADGRCWAHLPGHPGVGVRTRRVRPQRRADGQRLLHADRHPRHTRGQRHRRPRGRAGPRTRGTHRAAAPGTAAGRHLLLALRRRRVGGALRHPVPALTVRIRA